MTQAYSDALRAALDRVDRERTKAQVMIWVLFAMMGVMWTAMMFSKDDHTGLPYGLATVLTSVFVAGLGVAKTSHDNTRMILRAIETLAKEK